MLGHTYVEAGDVLVLVLVLVAVADVVCIIMNSSEEIEMLRLHHSLCTA